MRNQAFILAACAAVAIGCGGGGGDRNNNTNTTGTPGASGMTVSLPATSSTVKVAYLTGQGRAAGDPILQILTQDIQDSRERLNRNSLLPIDLNLAQYDTNADVTIDVGFNGENSRNFDRFFMTPSRLFIENATGGRDEASFANGASFATPFASRIRAFPGRATYVPIRLDDTMVTDNGDGTYNFDRSAFLSRNQSTSVTDVDAQGKIVGRLSDFVRFPLPTDMLPDYSYTLNGTTGTYTRSASPNLDPHPSIRTDQDDPNAVIANGGRYLYLSGDNVAISDGTPAGPSGSASSTGFFQELGDDFVDYGNDANGNPVFGSSVFLGRWSNTPNDLPGANGSYDLSDNYPDSPNNVRELVSVLGDFRDYTQVLSGGSGFEMILFPNSAETYTLQNSTSGEPIGRLGDVVAIAREGSSIRRVYVGTADLGNGTFSLFPVRALGANPSDPSAIGARLTGTLSGYSTALPTVRYLNYSFDSTSTANLPTLFTNSGVVTVFRR